MNNAFRTYGSKKLTNLTLYSYRMYDVSKLNDTDAELWDFKQFKALRSFLYPKRGIVDALIEQANN